MTLSRSDRAAILAKIEALVQKKFYDPSFNGRDWPAIVEQSRPLVLDASTVEEFEGQVALMLSKLDSSGLGLLGAQTKITSRNAINASFAAIETAQDGMRWAFQDVLPGGVAERGGIHPGEILISISQKQIHPPQMPAFPMGQTVDVVVSRKGQHSQVNLNLQTPRPKYKDNPYAEPQSISAAVTSAGVGRLRVSLFPGKIGIDFSNQLKATFADQLAEAERLVVDLRGNPGGGVGALRLMSFLTADARPVGYSLDRATAERGVNQNDLPRFNKIPQSKLAIPLLAVKFLKKQSVVLETEGLGPQRFHGRVVVLVNEHSTGAAEMVAQFAKENALATIVGTKTPGRLSARSAFKVGSNYRLTIPIGAYISWKGTRIEGRGIEPDITVPWSYEEACRGADNQLAKATEVAKTL
jgi:C-terminal processing protease CtpA/Prc